MGYLRSFLPVAEQPFHISGRSNIKIFPAFLQKSFASYLIFSSNLSLKFRGSECVNVKSFAPEDISSTLSSKDSLIFVGLFLMKNERRDASSPPKPKFLTSAFYGTIQVYFYLRLAMVCVFFRFGQRSLVEKKCFRASKMRTSRFRSPSGK